MSSRASGGRRASVRRLPPVVLLLLAALAVAVGPASAARSGVAAPAPAASVVAPAVDAGHRPSGTVDGTVPGSPARVDLRHASARTAAIERPPLDAVLPGVALAVALLVLVGRRGEEQRRPGLALPSGSARGPPASAV